MSPKARTLWLLAAVCFGPFAIALALFYGPSSHEWLPMLPGSREWIDPAVALPAEWLPASAEPRPAGYRWSVVYARMAACEADCAAELTKLDQVRRALGRDSERVEVILADTGAGAPPVAENGNPFERRALPDDVWRGLRRSLGDQRLATGRVLIADGRGQLVLSYPPEVAQRELLRDLKRLLAGTGTN